MADHPHAKLYNSRQWRKLRALQLAEHPLCRMHAELGQVVAATVVDHIKPHKGDMDLFLDGGNLQSLCKQCHDAHKQAQEHSASGLLRGAGLDGRPLDRAHPWHTQGGDEKSETPQLYTGPLPSFARV